MTGTLHYGTSSWSEKSWVGVFYPDGTPPGEWLGFYATRFDTVEADVTYYRVPDRRLVDGWNAKTPDGFRLAAKFPRSVVHGGDGPKPDGDKVLVPAHVGDDTARFLDAMGRLGDKCGPLVLQFPHFNRGAFASKAPFLERLDAFLGDLPDAFRYAVEVRNKTWIDADLCALLRRHDVALVLVDILYMPHPADLAESLDLVTTDFVYARLIGDRKAVEKETKTFDRIVVDQSRRLERWAKLLGALLERVPEAHCYANNHYAGHGPATIRDLVARMGDAGVVHLLWLLPLALLLLAWRRARAFDARVRAALDACRDAPAAPLGVAADVAADEAAERVAARSGLAAGAGRRWFAIEQDGAMRLREDGPWLPFRATQVFAAGAPWFAWVARFRLAGLPLRVVDALGPDGGWLEARLCGVVPVARARDAATTRAQRMRYLAELPWCPGAWRTNPALRVESIGAERMRVGLHDGSAAVDLELGPTGDVVGATALRPRATPAGSVDTPWAGRFADHRELDGLRMPTSATVAWRIDGREFAYWRARITRVAWR